MKGERVMGMIACGRCQPGVGRVVSSSKFQALSSPWVIVARILAYCGSERVPALENHVCFLVSLRPRRRWRMIWEVRAKELPRRNAYQQVAHGLDTWYVH